MIDLRNRSEVMELLEMYSMWLEEEGYMDVDWRVEGSAIDEFVRSLPAGYFDKK
jgi:hypothetical protein